MLSVILHHLTPLLGAQEWESLFQVHSGRETWGTDLSGTCLLSGAFHVSSLFFLYLLLLYCCYYCSFSYLFGVSNKLFLSHVIFTLHASNWRGRGNHTHVIRSTTKFENIIPKPRHVLMLSIETKT